MSVLCTICARGGSKGVPGKNIKNLLGKPLIAYTIEQALSNRLINRVVVSTDSEKIANVAKQYGAEVPFMRPQFLATDEASKLPVIKHAIKYYVENLNFNPNYVIDLDPTSPLRTSEDIEKCLNLIMNDCNCDLVITGYKSNKNPYFNMVEINSDGFACLSKKPEKQIVRRQDAPVVYAMNASVYIWKTDVLFNQTDVVAGKVKLVAMPEERSIDIDSEVDFKLVEYFMKEKK
ncbi:MAG: flagellar modification protein B [Planctomycetes bacterium GWF2_39_10]|nr:MAG: flagellar modification protein B [Planctomycetes bacterium GWA2_39_15]OHB47889.1 MAG: flagellar modification protein B [Planctomycetes bacterium GWF2_39_10]